MFADLLAIDFVMFLFSYRTNKRRSGSAHEVGGSSFDVFFAGGTRTCWDGLWWILVDFREFCV